MLCRRRDIKRLFAYSSIEHIGIATFAFGLGGPLANFGGLLHMTMHSLTNPRSSSPWVMSRRPRARSASARSAA
jgi:NADH:ubiquinone oxidoreductase subunit 2 (subunit N)